MKAHVLGDATLGDNVIEGKLAQYVNFLNLYNEVLVRAKKAHGPSTHARLG
jgi:hypothetical protein